MTKREILKIIPVSFGINLRKKYRVYFKNGNQVVGCISWCNDFNFRSELLVRINRRFYSWVKPGDIKKIIKVRKKRLV